MKISAEFDFVSLGMVGDIEFPAALSEFGGENSMSFGGECSYGCYSVAETGIC